MSTREFMVTYRDPDTGAASWNEEDTHALGTFEGIANSHRELRSIREARMDYQKRERELKAQIAQLIERLGELK